MMAKVSTMADSTRNVAGSSKRNTGLTNPMEICDRNGGPDIKAKGQSQNDLKASRLPQRLHEHPDGSRIKSGGDQRQYKSKVTNDVRFDGQLRSQLHASEFADDV